MSRPPKLVNVVGPICESADVLGHDRLLPVTREGDVLLIANAGAYGHAMSSRYNLREPAAGAVPLKLKWQRPLSWPALVVAVLLIAAYVFYLDRTVTKQFEGRRWTLPAQVYAAPLELYAGLDLSAAGARTRAAAPALPQGRQAGPSRQLPPGPARISRSRCARRASPTRARPAQLLTISSGARRHREPAAMPQVTTCAVLRLEPLLIGSIFPIHGEDRIVVDARGGAAAAAGGAEGRGGPQVRHPPRRRPGRHAARRCGSTCAPGRSSRAAARSRSSW